MTALLSSMFYASADHSAILKSDDHNALLQVETFARCLFAVAVIFHLRVCFLCAAAAHLLHLTFPFPLCRATVRFAISGT